MLNDIESICFTAEQIENKVKELGEIIAADYADKNPVVICILKGSLIFTADLMRCMDIPCQVDFMSVSSYGSGTSSSGRVKIKKDLDCDIAGRHILIVEDILDSGNTLSCLKNLLSARNPASISICTLFDKPARRVADITPEYVGFICPDAFIVGYGLDYAEKYRNLPFVGILKPEVYS